MLLWSCNQKPSVPEKKNTSHTYNLQVDDTNPMSGVEKRWRVEGRIYPRRNKPLASEFHGYLIVYSNFYAPNQEQRKTHFSPIPQDTLPIGLTRTQLDTIYQLTRRVFALPLSPKTVNKEVMPSPPASHDLDNFVVVGFQKDEFHGPRLECSGYQEGNDAAYMLQYELMLIEKHYLDRRKAKK